MIVRHYCGSRRDDEDRDFCVNFAVYPFSAVSNTSEFRKSYVRWVQARMPETGNMLSLPSMLQIAFPRMLRELGVRVRWEPDVTLATDDPCAVDSIALPLRYKDHIRAVDARTANGVLATALFLLCELLVARAIASHAGAETSEEDVPLGQLATWKRKREERASNRAPLVSACTIKAFSELTHKLSWCQPFCHVAISSLRCVRASEWLARSGPAEQKFALELASNACSTLKELIGRFSSGALRMAFEEATAQLASAPLPSFVAHDICAMAIPLL